jgi:hypothetical protein
MGKLVTLFVALAVIPITGPPAQAHDWYSGIVNEDGLSCCGGSDCAELADQYVDEVPGGYIVDIPAGAWKIYQGPFSAFVPDSRAQAARQGGNYHLCIVGGQVRCFFFPAPSY